MSNNGIYDLVMQSPMGEQKSALEITDGGVLMQDPDGVMQPVLDLAQDGDTISYKVQMVKPMPMKLAFKLKVEGDTISGEYRAGMFPPAKVSGTRAA